MKDMYVSRLVRDDDEGEYYLVTDAELNNLMLKQIQGDYLMHYRGDMDLSEYIQYDLKKRGINSVYCDYEDLPDDKNDLSKMPTLWI